MNRSRWFAHPWLSALLALSWLLLQQTLIPFHLIAALLIGVIVPRLLHDFLPRATPIRLLPALRLLGVVLWDIVLSNLTVARLVLGPMSRPRPAWVKVPLDLQHPAAVTVLACIITTTPGTVSCSIDEDGRYILVHALNCDDAEQMAAEIKARYERPLMAVFVEAGESTGETL